MKYSSFETERLILKPASADDAAFVLALYNSPKWIKYIGDRNIKTIEDAKRYIEVKMLPQFEKLGYSNYIVIRKSDGAKIGTCGLYERDGLTTIDIGFAFLPAYEKQGYGIEAASKMKEIGIHHFNIKEMCAITTKDNFSSQKLLEKLDFTYVKIIRIPNDDEDLLYYEFKA